MRHHSTGGNHRPYMKDYRRFEVFGKIQSMNEEYRSQGGESPWLGMALVAAGFVIAGIVAVMV